MKIFYSPKCLGYRQEGHPESPERIQRTADFLKKKIEFSAPSECSDEDLLLCHTKEHVASVRKGSFFDTDTPALKGIFPLAKLAVGSAIQAMESALNKEPAFSLMRPPGHHAGFKVEGFCYFNNLAIAVKKALEKVERVAIIDFDAHHGNGTQDIFLGDSKVLYVSLHQGGIYPGTGLVSKENCINYPLPHCAGSEEYLELFEKGLEKARGFRPSLVAVSAGFDAHKDDPLTSLSLDEETYGKIGQMLRGLGAPVFAVMEGGYSLKVPESVWAFLEGVE